MDRRNLLRSAVVGTGAVAFGFTMTRESFADPAQTGPSPYGPLQAADANGIMLPSGFTSRVIARSGQTVAGTDQVWHGAPDGGACFVDGSGWIYVSNAELGGGSGGVSAVRFDGSGSVTDSYRVLSGTTSNCSGGATPGTPGSPARRPPAASSSRPTRTACRRPNGGTPWADSSTRPRPPIRTARWCT